MVSHYNPDGDAIGSALAIYHFLNGLGQQVNVIIPNSIPEFLTWLPGADDIIIYNDEKEKICGMVEQAELVFYIDFNHLSRLEGLEKELAIYNKIGILIDHHPDPEIKTDLVISDVNVSSAAELVYNFILGFGKEDYINKDIATCIYTGIMTDTVNFRYNMSDKTHGILAQLFKTGIKSEIIHHNVYDHFSYNRMKLLGFALNERLVVLNEFNTAYIYLFKQDLDQFNFKNGDSEGFVNYPLSIKNIKFSVLFIEQEEYIKISLRSKGEFPVNDFAKRHFNGGGHKNAAGGKSFLSLKDTLTGFEKTLIDYKEKIKY